MYLTFTLADGTSYHAGPIGSAATIGSSGEGSEIVLPSEALAAQHAIIEPTEDGSQWQIRDISSADGLSDGTSVAPAFLLADGSTVYLGDVRLDVSFTVPAAPEPATAPVSAQQPPVSAGASAQIERIRAAQKRRDLTGTCFLVAVLAVVAFAAGFAFRYLQ